MNSIHDRVLVPSHTPKPLPKHLRSELTSALLSNSSIPTIQSTLYDTSRDAGWMDAVRERAKHLKENQTELSLQEVVELLARESRERTSDCNMKPGGLRRAWSDEDGEKRAAQSVSDQDKMRFPEQAIVEGKEVIRRALEDIVEVEAT
ncbi:MAG: hypothetical protein Q9219_003781 [cf. Caloplaca sp. 3 TL-2023]